ncbi:MAG: hypothetical protein ACOC2L_05320 [Candidatus Sumerlaeota bacterium]
MPSIGDLPDRGAREPSAVGSCLSTVIIWTFFLSISIFVGAVVVKFLPYFLFFMLPNLRERMVQADTESAMNTRAFIGGALGAIIALKYLISMEKEKRQG